MSSDNLRSGTWITHQAADQASLSVRRCRIEVTAGPNSGLVREFDTPVIRIGARAGVDLVLDDRKVSGIHVEILLDESGYRLRDLESTNGTYIKGLRVRDLYLAPNTRFAVGQSELKFTPLASSVEVLPGVYYGNENIEDVHRKALMELVENYGIRRSQVLLTSGDPAEQLGETIVENDVDLVVLGALKRGRLEQWLLGSTAERVVAEVSCDVLLIKPEA